MVDTIITGMNLPLLIKLASLRGETPIKTLVAEAREAGRKYINVASELLAGDPAKSAAGAKSAKGAKGRK